MHNQFGSRRIQHLGVPINLYGLHILLISVEQGSLVRSLTDLFVCALEPEAHGPSSTSSSDRERCRARHGNGIAWLIGGRPKILW